MLKALINLLVFLIDWIPIRWLMMALDHRLKSQHQAAQLSRGVASPIPPVPEPTIPCADKAKIVDELGTAIDVLLGKLEIAVEDYKHCLASHAMPDARSDALAAVFLMGELNLFVQESVAQGISS